MNEWRTIISNFPTLAVVTLSAGGNPTLECKASPLISAAIIQTQKKKTPAINPNENQIDTDPKFEH